jgi:mono/diheme cytochrome c family protein
MQRQWATRLIYALMAGLLAAVAWVSFDSQSRINHIWQVPAPALTVGDDAVLAERGEHLARSRGCAECHGVDFGGRVLIDDALFGKVVATNLTSGSGGVAKTHSDAQLAQAIREGLRADGRSEFVMPSETYRNLGDEDIAAIIAFLRKTSPVDNALGETRLGIGARITVSLMGAPLLVAEQIDHAAPRAPVPAVDATAEYGGYIAQVCTGCHGANFAGGPVPGAPGEQMASNLTPAGRIAGWTYEQFAQALRRGRLPDGKVLDPRLMPWTAYGEFNDTEVAAIQAYLKTLPSALPKP